ncbi:extracellular solute-binding protein [candidate division WWE3 bacterium]|nr:extracellular solute-binding protein [candidate division WWE3 bacterium]
MDRKDIGLIALILLIIGGSVVGINWWYQANVDAKSVTIYVSESKNVAQPILDDFENATGIKVHAIYDSDNSISLTDKLIDDKEHPRADLYWNSEVSRTIKLKQEGVLQKYKPEQYNALDPSYKDPEGYWTAVTGHARVFIINNTVLSEKEIPHSLLDLINTKFADHIIATDPRNLYTQLHYATLFSVLGPVPAQDLLFTLKRYGLLTVQTDDEVIDSVLNGNAWIGIVNSDVALSAQNKHKELMVRYPDQGTKEMGTLIIPSTLGLIQHARHQENAQRLYNFIVSPSTASRLAQGELPHIPLLTEASTSNTLVDLNTIRTADVQWESVYESIPSMLLFYKELMVTTPPK